MIETCAIRLLDGTHPRIVFPHAYGNAARNEYVLLVCAATRDRSTKADTGRSQFPDLEAEGRLFRETDGGIVASCPLSE